MLLAIDIGNTSTEAGIFDGDSLVKTFRIESSFNAEEFDEFLLKNFGNQNFEKIIIASVIKNKDFLLKNFLDKKYNVDSFIVNSDSPLDFCLNLDSPSSLGADRIANVAAAHSLYKYPAAVIDVGTATTFDIIDEKGDFSGGLIMSGLRLQLESLFDKTSKLPLVEIRDINTAMAKNTEDAILAGVVLGHAFAIDGLIKQYEKELNQKLTVILTGGYSNFICKHLSINSYILNPNLTLEGLRIIAYGKN